MLKAEGRTLKAEGRTLNAEGRTLNAERQYRVLAINSEVVFVCRFIPAEPGPFADARRLKA
jgi:hypothetical protein